MATRQGRGGQRCGGKVRGGGERVLPARALARSQSTRCGWLPTCEPATARRHGASWLAGGRTVRLGWRVGARRVSAGGWAECARVLPASVGHVAAVGGRCGSRGSAAGHAGAVEAGLARAGLSGWLGLGSRAGRTESKTKPSPKCARSAASHFALDEMISDFSIERSASCVPITYLLGLGSGLGPGLGLGLGCGYRRRRRT